MASTDLPHVDKPKLTGAIIMTVIAAVPYLIVNLSFVNFYFGNIGIGHGGDMGMLGVLVYFLFVLLMCVVLWILLFSLQVLATWKGKLSGFGLVISICLLLLSAVAIYQAQNLITPSPSTALELGRPDGWETLRAAQRWPLAPYAWPILEAALVPVLFVVLGFWALSPALCRKIPLAVVKWGTWSAIALLSVVIILL